MWATIAIIPRCNIIKKGREWQVWGWVFFVFWDLFVFKKQNSLGDIIKAMVYTEVFEAPSLWDTWQMK